MSGTETSPVEMHPLPDTMGLVSKSKTFSLEMTVDSQRDPHWGRLVSDRFFERHLDLISTLSCPLCSLTPNLQLCSGNLGDILQ